MLRVPKSLHPQAKEQRKPQQSGERGNVQQRSRAAQVHEEDHTAGRSISSSP